MNTPTPTPPSGAQGLPTPQRTQVHVLKTWPMYYYAVTSGAKTFEIRQNDRAFQVGDVLILRSFDPETETYDGQEAVRTITYITDFAQKPGFVVMGISQP